jgi:hypothetical protein
MKDVILSESEGSLVEQLNDVGSDILMVSLWDLFNVQ